MLFDFGNNVFESKKERNLYAKYLAGYYFNELVPGWEHRLQLFTILLSERAAQNNPLHVAPVAMAPTSTHVAFDCHIHQLGSDSDRGEFADCPVPDQLREITDLLEAYWNLASGKKAGLKAPVELVGPGPGPVEKKYIRMLATPVSASMNGPVWSFQTRKLMPG